MRISEMRINGIREPIGFDLAHLMASWKVTETESTQAVRCEVEVSSDPEFSHILFETKTAGNHANLQLNLTPRTRYFWRVRVEGDAGDCAEAKDFFETGKMDEPWQAEWIAAEKEDEFHPVLEKTFTVSPDVANARLYISGVGLFEAYLNGRKIGHEYLTPYLTAYEKRIQVITFPVKDLLSEGKNTLSIYLGKGWYMGTYGLGLTDKNYGDRMAAIAELYLEKADGSEELIKTDDSWMYRGSDVESSGIYDGEVLNRMRWTDRANPDRPVSVIRTFEKGTANLPKSHLADRLSLPVVVCEKLPPKELIHTPAGETVLDFGQNFAGFVSFHAALPKGTRVKLECAEILQNGNFYHKNYRDVKSEFVYVSDGRKEDVRAHFTFFGFRYIKVTGWPGEPDLTDFTGCALCSDLDRTGYIRTGNEKINRLYENTLWGQRSNFIDMPTDCPQRSERLGWTGDAQVFSPTASYHMNTEAFFRKYEQQLRDEQEMIGGAIANFVPNIGHKDDAGPVWGDAGTIIPWNMYRYYGNASELKEAYPMMKDWVEWMRRQDESPKHEHKHLYDFGFTFGDWLALDGATETSFKGSTDDAYVASVYYMNSARIVSQAAGVLAENEKTDDKNAERYRQDEKMYTDLADAIREAILDEFFTPNGRLAVDTQTGLTLALHFGIWRDRSKLIDQVKKRLKKDLWKIKGGFAGAPIFCTTLAESGMTDAAYDFLFNEEFPGWLYEVNLGATTVWERWNSVLPDGRISDQGMNSLNHYAYGSVMEFVYAYAAGIRPAAPGFAEAVIDPHPDIRLRSLECRYDSAAGMYESDWKINEDGTLTVRVKVPFGCRAKVILPRDPEGRKLDLKAGTYHFTYRPTQDFRSIFSWDTRISKAAKVPEAEDILKKYTPALAGICHDPEMGCMTFREVLSMPYLGVGPDELKKAMKQLAELYV